MFYRFSLKLGLIFSIILGLYTFFVAGIKNGWYIGFLKGTFSVMGGFILGLGIGEIIAIIDPGIKVRDFKDVDKKIDFDYIFPEPIENNENKDIKGEENSA